MFHQEASVETIKLRYIVHHNIKYQYSKSHTQNHYSKYFLVALKIGTLTGSDNDGQYY